MGQTELMERRDRLVLLVLLESLVLPVLLESALVRRVQLERKVLLVPPVLLAQLERKVPRA